MNDEEKVKLATILIALKITLQELVLMIRHLEDRERISNPESLLPGVLKRHADHLHVAYNTIKDMSFDD